MHMGRDSGFLLYFPKCFSICILAVGHNTDKDIGFQDPVGIRLLDAVGLFVEENNFSSSSSTTSVSFISSGQEIFSSLAYLRTRLTVFLDSPMLCWLSPRFDNLRFSRYLIMVMLFFECIYALR